MNAPLNTDDFDAPRLGHLVRDPLGLLRRRWGWMLIVGVLGMAATVAFVFLGVPVRYRAEATVLIASQRIPDEFVRSTVRDQPFEKINAMIGEILSREKLARLIEEHGLYPALRDKKPLSDVVYEMRRDVSIEPDVGVGQAGFYETARLYRVSFREERADVAAAVANDLSSLLTTANIRMRTQQARLTTEFLRRELERSEEELRKQQSKITEFKQRSPGGLPGDLETNIRRLESLQQQRQSLALQIAEAETRRAALSTGAVAAPDETTPQGRLLVLRSRLAEEAAVNTEQHPNVVSLKRQIEALEKSLGIPRGGGVGGSRAALIAGAGRTIAELKRQLERTDTTIREMDAQVVRMPALQEELAALEERATVLREKYLEFLRKVEEAELAETLESAQQGERVSVLDRAAPPTRPERSRLKFLAVGSLGTLTLVLGVGLMLEVRDPVLVSDEQIQTQFGLPVLGSIPRVA